MHQSKEIEYRPLVGYARKSSPQMIKASKDAYENLSQRRTIREFSTDPIPLEVIKYCIRAAGTAPSGANLQPWHFVVVTDPSVKKQIQVEAEKEEREFYENKAPKEWLKALAPLGTNWKKEFLSTAPTLIVIFAKSYRISPGGKKIKNYYVQESVGIATGLLINALHQAGLVSLTHTPSPMNFLNKLCGRPKNERPFMILVTGFPAESAQFPVHGAKKLPLEKICTFL